MSIWIIVIAVVIITVMITFSLSVTCQRSDRMARKLWLDKMIQDGEITLPDCEHAYENYLYEYVNFDQLHNGSTCGRSTANKKVHKTFRGTI